MANRRLSSQHFQMAASNPTFIHFVISLVSSPKPFHSLLTEMVLFDLFLTFFTLCINTTSSLLLI